MSFKDKDKYKELEDIEKLVYITDQIERSDSLEDDIQTRLTLMTNRRKELSDEFTAVDSRRSAKAQI